jgi:hypothetical protein
MPPLPTRAAPVSLDEFCERFGLRTASGRLARRRGRRLMGQFRTMRFEGGGLWTTEEWLVEGLAQRALPPLITARQSITLDPLRDEVLGMAVELLRDMAARGFVRLYDLDGLRGGEVPSEPHKLATAGALPAPRYLPLTK